MTLLKTSLDAQGRLMVDDHLRVKGHKNVFAAGDITDIREMKQGYLAQRAREGGGGEREGTDERREGE
ncbi:unnamed protein product [Rhodiola kirilowii]